MAQSTHALESARRIVESPGRLDVRSACDRSSLDERVLSAKFEAVANAAREGPLHQGFPTNVANEGGGR